MYSDSPSSSHKNVFLFLMVGLPSAKYGSMTGICKEKRSDKIRYMVAALPSLLMHFTFGKCLL